jgi:hypothetical protein
LRRVVHNHSAGLIVDLGVHAGIPDQVHNPFLTLVFGEAETF